MLEVDYTSEAKQKLLERTRFVVSRGSGEYSVVGEHGLDEGSQKWHRLPVIREISAMDVRFNLINAINNAVCYIRKLFIERKP